MDDLMKSPSAIMEMIEDSDALKINKRLNLLDMNFFVFERNYQDLKLTISTFTNSEHTRLLFNAEESETILRHVVRMLHNFVAAAKSLVDHTRSVIREGYRGTEFYDEYNNQIKIRFSNNPLTAFIEGLRNYALHYSFPHCGVNVRVELDPTSGEYSEVVHFFMEKETLLRWSGWRDEQTDKKGKVTAVVDKGENFLKTAPDIIIVDQICNQYFEQIVDFHVWMHKRLEEIHLSELTWLREMNDGLRALLKPAGLGVTE